MISLLIGILSLLGLFATVNPGWGQAHSGDKIGPQNWEEAKDIVPQNLLKRIKAGYVMEIAPPSHYRTVKEFTDATEKYSGQVKISADGNTLIGYVAGLPFPKIDPADSQAGEKAMWNYWFRWRGDDSLTGGARGEEKIARFAIEQDGSERRADIKTRWLFPTRRVTLDPKPTIPGSTHIYAMQFRVDDYPRDNAGTTLLEIRYHDPNTADDSWIYLPSLRRIRRLTTTQRCQTLAPSEFNFDDIQGFNGKINYFTYKFLGSKTVPIIYRQQNVPAKRNKGDYLPLEEKWELHESAIVEIKSKDPGYCYPKKVLYLNKETWRPDYAMMWDRKGEYWKEMFINHETVTLSDGRETYTTGGVFVINVQNGRSTVLEVGDQYNLGWTPSMFSLAALQEQMRGGTLKRGSRKE